MRASHGKSFLDTNVFIYTFDASTRLKRSTAQRLVTEALQRHTAVISYQVVQEFLNVATRKFDQPLPPSDAEAYLAQVLMPLCEVYPDSSLYSRAIAISAEARISFYDALIVSSGIAASCSVLWTEDLQHGRRFGPLEVRNPFI